MLAQTSLCFLAIVASATTISISGLASLDANAFAAQGKLIFPRIPGINTPLFSSRLSEIDDDDTDVENIEDFDFASDPAPARLFFPGHHRYGYNFNNLANIIPLPNITALLESRNITNATTVIVQPVAPLPSLHKFFHGFNLAVYHARKHLAEALNTTGDVTLGIQSALQRALLSDDPAGAVNTLIQTILYVYGTAIQKCPILFMCAKLASEAASLVQRVITGIMTATVIP